MTILRFFANCNDRSCTHNNGRGGCSVAPTIKVENSGARVCHTYEKNKFEKMSADLTVTANNIVGDVGEPTAYHTSVTGEQYITACIKASSLVVLGALWFNWVAAYKVYSECTKREGLELPATDPVIYWRIKPEIVDSGITGPNRFSLRARLLISTYSPNE